MEFRFFENKKSEKQAFIAANNEAILVAFRGTDATVIKDWLSDLNFFMESGPWGEVHGGFQYALSSIWPEMKAFLKPLLDSPRKLMITGHSLGGAMAVLATADLVKAGRSVFGLHIFGQPSTGDSVFVREFAKRMNDYYFRFVNHNDIVPRSLPAKITRYQHAGQKLYFDRHGKMHKDPHDLLELWDQWICKLTFQKVFAEDFGDHMMAGYITNLERGTAPGTHIPRPGL